MSGHSFDTNKLNFYLKMVTISLGLGIFFMIGMTIYMYSKKKKIPDETYVTSYEVTKGLKIDKLCFPISTELGNGFVVITSKSNSDACNFIIIVNTNTLKYQIFSSN